MGLGMSDASVSAEGLRQGKAPEPEAGAKPSFTPYEISLPERLSIAAQEGDLDKVRELLPQVPKDHCWREGITPLMLAAGFSHPECVVELMEHFDPLARADMGITALMMAANARYGIPHERKMGVILALWDRGGPLMRMRTKDGRELYIDELAEALGKDDLVEDLRALRQAEQVREGLRLDTAGDRPAGKTPRI